MGFEAQRDDLIFTAVSGAPGGPTLVFSLWLEEERVMTLAVAETLVWL